MLLRKSHGRENTFNLFTVFSDLFIEKNLRINGPAFHTMLSKAHLYREAKLRVPGSTGTPPPVSDPAAFRSQAAWFQGSLLFNA